jgi:hypothetical protein
VPLTGTDLYGQFAQSDRVRKRVGSIAIPRGMTCVRRPVRKLKTWMVRGQETRAQRWDVQGRETRAQRDLGTAGPGHSGTWAQRDLGTAGPGHCGEVQMNLADARSGDAHDLNLWRQSGVDVAKPPELPYGFIGHRVHRTGQIEASYGGAHRKFQAAGRMFAKNRRWQPR